MSIVKLIKPFIKRFGYKETIGNCSSLFFKEAHNGFEQFQALKL